MITQHLHLKGHHFIPLLIFVCAFLIYFFSNLTPLQWYKHYVYLAQAFLEVRADLQGLPDFYHDIVLYKGKAYLPNPPMPAVMLLPAVAIWGVDTDEVRISMLFGAANVALVWIWLGRLGVENWKRWLLTILFGFGTVHWEVATRGTMWFFAHMVAIFFLLLALIEFFGKRRTFLVGFLLGLACLSRLSVMLAALFFLFLLFWEEKATFLKKSAYFAIGLAIPLAFLGYYNFLRFGNPLETGYFAQNFYSSVQSPDIARWGLFDLHYLPRHLYLILLKPPDYLDHFPFLRPSPEGMSLLLTTPAIIYALQAKVSRLNLTCWLTILAILSTSLFYIGTGWVQFGYRYSLDFSPFLLLLIGSGMDKPTWGKFFLVALSVAINLWGVLWSVKLGW